MMKKELFEGAYIELRGNEDLLIEGCDGLLDYRDECIKVKIGEKTLDILGKSLRMRYLSEKKIAVTGEIQGVMYV